MSNKRTLPVGRYCPNCGRMKTKNAVYCSLKCRQGRYRLRKRAIREGWYSMLSFDQVSGLLQPMTLDFIGRQNELSK